ncbi:MAG: PEP-utilizing enzyme [Actinomycetota bacterium]
MPADATDPTHETSEPDRFWSTVNALEATPLVLTALDWTFWKKSLELAAMRAWCDLGIVSPDEVVFVDDADQRVTAAFYGRQAVNIDRVRWLMGSLPGTSGDDIERDIFGEVRPGIVDPPRKVSKLAMARGFPRSLRRHHGEVADFRAAIETWWRIRVGDDPPGSPSKRLLEATRRFEDAQRLHIRGRSLLQGLGAQVQELATGAGRPDLIAALTSGVGEMEETTVVDDLWRVAHGELDLADFLARHGYHGNGEGNVSATVWREDPSLVERLVPAYADVPAGERPTARSAGTQAAREQAVAELMAALPRPRRRLSGWVLNKTVELTRDLEVSKATFLMAIDAGRAAARQRGAELVAAGAIDDAADVLHLTVEEATAANLGDVRELVAARRARHAHHLTVRPPDTWTGNPTAEPIVGAGERRDRLDGVAGSPGRVEGLARVISDPAVDEPPAPGEILVCAMTDPSWALMFVMAAGLVIDIGGPASHGAIIARELGVPCVINTETGTVDIRTGDRLVVDGDEGVVHIAERVGA